MPPITKFTVEGTMFNVGKPESFGGTLTLSTLSQYQDITKTIVSDNSMTIDWELSTPYYVFVRVLTAASTNPLYLTISGGNSGSTSAYARIANKGSHFQGIVQSSHRIRFYSANTCKFNFVAFGL